MEKYAIFDFDGTIVESRSLAIKLINDLSNIYGYKRIGEADINHIRDMSILGKLRFLKISPYKIPAIFLELKKKYKVYIDTLEIVEGILDVLYELKKERIGLAIISSNSKTNIDAFLRNKNIDLFDIVCSSEGFLDKNKSIETIMKKHKIKKENVFYIGDEVRDIVACKKSNLKIIAVTWGYDPIEILEKQNPDYIVESPKQILDIIIKKNLSDSYR